MSGELIKRLVLNEAREDLVEQHARAPITLDERVREMQGLLTGVCLH
jgi:hypothetical protein